MTFWLKFDDEINSEAGADKKGIVIYEEDRPEIHLEINRIGSKEITSLSVDNAFILGNALLDWVERIKGKEWIDSATVVFECGKSPYVKEKGA